MSGMEVELAPLRRAHGLLRSEKSVDEVISELQVLFGLDFVDAMAAASTVVLLMERGRVIPEDRFVQPNASRP